MTKQPKIFIFAILALTLITAFGTLFLNQLIAEKVQTSLAEKANIFCGDIEVNVWSRTINLIELRGEKLINLEADSLGQRIKVNASSIALEGIGILAFIFENQLKINHLKIEHPEIEVYKNVSFEDNSNEKLETPNTIKALCLDKISITNGGLKIFNEETPNYSTLSLEKFRLNFGNVYCSLPQRDSFVIENTQFEAQNFRMIDDDDLHDFVFKRLKGTAADSTLYIENFAIEPRFSKEDFVKQLKYKKSRLDFVFPRIQFSGWDFQGLAQGKFQARLAEIDSIDFYIYQDKNIPRNPNRYKKLPSEMLAKLPFQLHVDRMKVRNGFIRFDMIPAEKKEISSLHFFDTNADISNISNDSVNILTDAEMMVYVTTKLENEAHFENYFRFHLDKEDYSFSYAGVSDAFSLSIINPFITPVASVRINSGKAKKVEFEAYANAYETNGQMTFFYEDLDLKLTSKERRVDKKLLKLFVNNFVIKPNNLSQNSKYRVGKIYKKRETDRSFFSYWWRGIQSGLISTMLPNIALNDELEHEKVKN
jgi:hypothetical protein